MSDEKPGVGIIMGSRSDWPTMKAAADVLDELGVPYETKVVSAHRTPERLYDYAKSAKARGLKVIIAGAGGAAHLPGMTASMTDAAGARRAGRQPRRCRARTACSPSSRCPPASRSARWPSARPAPPMPACWRRRSWRSPTMRSPPGSWPGAAAQTDGVAEAPRG